MRKEWWVVGLMLCAVAASGQGRIIAQLSQLRNDKGICQVCLFNNPKAFNGDGGLPFQCRTIVPRGGVAQAIFDAVPSGTYALFVLHDENSNGKMDKNFLGIPKEGYGASQNRLPFAAAPTFEANKFVMNNQTLQLQIRMRNL